MKLRESAAFKLFDRHGISHPKIIDMRLPRSLQSLAMTSRVVVKADLAIGGKKKAGLVQICDFSETEKVMKKMGVPVIDMDGEVVIGFDRERIDEILKLK